MSKRPVIDLSIGTYDDLETKLSQFLGLKVLLLHGWDAPRAAASVYRPPNPKTGVAEEFNCHSADPAVRDLSLRHVRWYSKSQDRNRDEAKDPLGENPITTARRESLRNYLYGRDPQISGSLSDIDLDAIASTGHLTLRASNAAPPYAIVVADQDFSDADTLKKWLTGLYDFTDAYDRGVYPGKIAVTGFLENMDIDPVQARAYEALRKIRFALRHQHEHDNKDRYWSYMPFFYQFAQLHTYERKQDILDESNSVSFHELKDMYEGDLAIHYGKFVDDDFMEKLLQARSLGDLHYFGTNPMQTLARLVARNRQIGIGLWPGEFNLNDFAQFQNALEEAISKKYKGLTGVSFAQDLRIRIPIFREIYKNGTWNKTEQAYLDTIWAGLERFMPTLAHAPSLTAKGISLPKNAADYRKMTDAPNPPAPEPS